MKTGTGGSCRSARPSATEVLLPHPASIQPILDYLRQSPHFSKYNRSAYAYRVE